MDGQELAYRYRAYIACLNERRFDELGLYVSEDARHNGRTLGVDGYRAMLERDVHDIPDLVFHIELLICEPPKIAARLRFDCHPAGLFLGIKVNGRRVEFCENVIYEFRDGRISEVWSVIDKQAIETQLE
ncbi:ester cyclase [Oryzifoliimicrobium ureilyticus]|uniref:ester cyclase n=1 Tax=Oryzifoliimicrobium ureilyticus TaxID=3113724 RepID=UPI0030765412